MNKKAIAILGAIFILIVGTLGFLIYSKYSGGSTSNTQTPAPVPAPTPAPTSQDSPPDSSASSTQDGSSPTPVSQNGSAVVKLTEDHVVSPALFYNGQGLTYFDNQGNLFQATLQDNNGQLQLTQKKQLNIPLKPGIAKILWPTKGDDFIAQFTDNTGKTAWSYFNSTSQTYTDLPPQVFSFDWMPNGNQIIYVWSADNKSSISIASPDTKNYKKLADMWENNNIISVSPDGSQILFYQQSNSAPSNAINSVTTDGKIWKGLVKNGQNFGVLWSPDSQKFLFGKKDLNTQKYQLWVYNLTSGEVKNLGLFTTTEKAVWDKDSNIIYVSVPVQGAPGENVLTQDSFFRMDTNTLDKKQYNAGSSPIDGRNLFLNPTGDKLFFKNAQDGGLYYLDLTQ